MEKLTREEFDEVYESYMNDYRSLIADYLGKNKNDRIDLFVNPRGHFLVTKDLDQLYLGTSPDVAISAYNKALGNNE